MLIDTCRFDQLLSAGTRGEPSEKARSTLGQDRILSWKKIEFEVEEAHKAHKAKPASIPNARSVFKRARRSLETQIN